MKTDRFSFPLVALTIIAAVIIALLDPAWPTRTGAHSAPSTLSDN